MKKLKYILLFLLLLLPSLCFATAQTCYVSSSVADDTGIGTEGDPFQTFEHVNNWIDDGREGDQITVNLKKGDTWTADEPIGFPDGSPINFLDGASITITAYGEGDLPKIDADSMTAVRIQDPSDFDVTVSNLFIYGQSSSYGNQVYVLFCAGTVIIDNVDGDGRGDGSVTAVGQVSRLRSITGDIEVKNCDLNGFGPQTNPTPDTTDTHIFLIDWPSSDGPYASPGNIKFHDNILHSVNADTLQVGAFHGAGGANIFEIYNNQMYDFGENAIDLKNCGGMDIHDNLFYGNGWGKGGSSSHRIAVIGHGDGAIYAPRWVWLIFTTMYSMRTQMGLIIMELSTLMVVSLLHITIKSQITFQLYLGLTVQHRFITI